MDLTRAGLWCQPPRPLALNYTAGMIATGSGVVDIRLLGVRFAWSVVRFASGAVGVGHWAEL